MAAPCWIAGCGRPARRRGWCPAHASRFYRHGDPLAGTRERRPKDVDPADWFWRYVDKEGAVPTFRPDLGHCWIWTGYRSARGYGRLSIGGQTYLAHNVAYEIVVGLPISGLEPDHLCRVTSCVNPAHIEHVTHQENTRRGFAVKIACPVGHPYDDVNTYVDPEGHRRCRACARERDRARAR